MGKKKTQKKKPPGRISNKAMDAIREGVLTDEDIAIQYEKTVEAIATKRAELAEKNKMTTEDTETLYRLRGSYFWGSTKKVLFSNEIDFFEQEWVQLHNQFASQGVLHTDEIMMKDLILHEIMAHRAAEQKRKILSEVSIIQTQINKELKKKEKDEIMIASLGMQKSNLQATMVSATKEHIEYQKKKDDKLEQLKATRSQRLKQAEMAGKNIWEMIKELDRPEMRRKYGKYMQKMRISADEIRAKWHESIEYEDGQWDQPLLSPDDIVEEKKDEKLSSNKEKK